MVLEWDSVDPFRPLYMVPAAMHRIPHRAAAPCWRARAQSAEGALTGVAVAQVKWRYPSANLLALGVFIGLAALYVPVELNAPVVANLSYGTWAWKRGPPPCSRRLLCSVFSAPRQLRGPARPLDVGWSLHRPCGRPQQPVRHPGAPRPLRAAAGALGFAVLAPPPVEHGRTPLRQVTFVWSGNVNASTTTTLCALNSTRGCVLNASDVDSRVLASARQVRRSALTDRPLAR